MGDFSDFAFDDGTGVPPDVVAAHAAHTRGAILDAALPTIDAGFARRDPEWDGELAGTPVLLTLSATPMGPTVDEDGGPAHLVGYQVGRHPLTHLMGAMGSMDPAGVLLGAARSWARLRQGHPDDDEEMRLAVVYAAEFDPCSCPPGSPPARWCDPGQDTRRLYAVDTFGEVYRYSRGRDTGQVAVFHGPVSGFDHPGTCHDTDEYSVIQALHLLGAAGSVHPKDLPVFLETLDRYQPGARDAERRAHEHAHGRSRS